MKRYILIPLLLLSAFNLFSQEEADFTINGKFATSYYDGLTVYLNEIDYKNTNSILKKDSIVVENGEFTFSGVLDKPISLGYITLQGDDNITAVIMLEKGVIGLEMSEVPQMSGTAKNDELRDFSNEQIKNNKELQMILERAQYLHKTGILDRSTNDKLEIDFRSQQILMKNQVFAFVKKNILNELGEFFFTIYAANLGASDLEKLYALADEEFQKSPVVRHLMSQYAWDVVDLREGQIFKGVELKNKDGEVINIETHFGKGKVVLVDFWASWCAPCVKTMPVLVRLYERYRDSDFEIVGISLDEDESNWKSAIKRFGIEWPQYIDEGAPWKGIAARQYKITQIPQTYLLDKEGKIVGHDLDGEKLIEKIEELLNQK